MNSKMAKMLAFFGVIFACITAAFNTFRVEWVKYKEEFPDLEPDYNEDLSNEQLAQAQANGIYQQPMPVEGALIDPLAQQQVFQQNNPLVQPTGQRVYTDAEVQAIIEAVRKDNTLIDKHEVA